MPICVNLTNYFYDSWVCRKMGHAQNRTILLEKLILKHQVLGYAIFRRNHIEKSRTLRDWYHTFEFDYRNSSRSPQ